MMLGDSQESCWSGSCSRNRWGLEFFLPSGVTQPLPNTAAARPLSELDSVFFGLLGDIFESFSSHPPLILPLGSSRLRLTGPVTDDALHRELRRLRRLLWDLEQQELPANHRHGPPVATPP